MSEELKVQTIMYSNWRLKVAINGKRYEYRDISPWVFEHFEMLLRYNKGRALAFIRGRSIGKEV